MTDLDRKPTANGRVVLAGFGALMLAIAIALLVLMPRYHVLPIGVVFVFGLPGVALLALALVVRRGASR